MPYGERKDIMEKRQRQADPNPPLRNPYASVKPRKQGVHVSAPETEAFARRCRLLTIANGQCRSKEWGENKQEVGGERKQRPRKRKNGNEECCHAPRSKQDAVCHSVRVHIFHLVRMFHALHFRPLKYASACEEQKKCPLFSLKVPFSAENVTIFLLL